MLFLKSWVCYDFSAGSSPSRETLANARKELAPAGKLRHGLSHLVSVPQNARDSTHVYKCIQMHGDAVDCRSSIFGSTQAIWDQWDPNCWGGGAAVAFCTACRNSDIHTSQLHVMLPGFPDHWQLQKSERAASQLDLQRDSVTTLMTLDFRWYPSDSQISIERFMMIYISTAIRPEMYSRPWILHGSFSYYTRLSYVLQEKEQYDSWKDLYARV